MCLAKSGGGGQTTLRSPPPEILGATRPPCPRDLRHWSGERFPAEPAAKRFQAKNRASSRLADLDELFRKCHALRDRSQKSNN